MRYHLDTDGPTTTADELEQLFREAEREVTLDEIQRRALEKAERASIVVLPSQEELVAQLKRPS